MEQKKQSVLGLTGMIIGVVSVGFIFLWVGAVPAVIGFILSLVSLLDRKNNNGCAVAGVALNASALLIFLLMLTFTIIEDSEPKEVSTNKVAEDFTATPEPTPTEIPIISCKIDNCYVEYLKHKKVTIMGYDCVAVFFQFTNKSSEAKCFAYTAYLSAFQNGIELDTFYWQLKEQDSEEFTKIKPNSTIEVYSLFELRDDSDIELEITEWVAFERKVKDEMIIKLE